MDCDYLVLRQSIRRGEWSRWYWVIVPPTSSRPHSPSLMRDFRGRRLRASAPGPSHHMHQIPQILRLRHLRALDRPHSYSEVVLVHLRNIRQPFTADITEDCPRGSNEGNDVTWVDSPVLAVVGQEQPVVWHFTMTPALLVRERELEGWATTSCGSFIMTNGRLIATCPPASDCPQHETNVATYFGDVALRQMARN